MAGIGFRLQKILHKDSYYDLAKGFLYSVIISSGPWLLSIFGIFVIGLVSSLFMGQKDILLFKAVVVYVYAGSLILTGIIQMGTTRYIADRLYVRDEAALSSCYNFVSLIVVLFAAAAGIPFFKYAGLEWRDTFAAVVMLQAISLIWMGMIFLSAAKDYTAIVRAFAVGYFASITLAYFIGKSHGITGLMWGFAVGQIALAVLLGIRVKVEFGSHRSIDSTVHKYWKAMPELLCIGFFFNLGIWIDKIMFWSSVHSFQIKGLFRATPGYDTCMYIGYLTIFPAVALFLLSIETSFYKFYASYYMAITQGESLKSILREKEAMIQSLRESAAQIIGIQGFISFFIYAVAPQWMNALNIPLHLLPTMRMAVLASFLQILFMDLTVVLLYFDWQRHVAWLTFWFAVLNGAFSYLCTQLPAQYHAIGYFAACLISLVAAMAILDTRMKKLEFETFTKQPIRN